MDNIYSEKISIVNQRTINDFMLSVLGPSKPGKIIWHTLQVEPLPMGQGLVAESDVNYNETELRVLIEDHEIADSRYSEKDWRRRSRELVRRVILEILKIRLPWGILTGVRPSKLYHMLRRKGFSAEEVEERLRRNYLLEGAKAALLRKVGEIQQPFIQGNANEIGVYIGIPFCPTRCRYCSFASHPLTTHGHLVAGFLEALLIEVEWAVQFCHKVGWKVGSIYIGGGTPTTLSAPDFQRIFSKLANLPKKQNMEFTVEAGRPETITDEHLAVFNEWGVNRISVNPQTMHDDTLRKIGRAHQVSDVFKAVERVRKAKIPIMNMDIIAGLPGESTDYLDYTLDALLKLAPENITIHTLAPKRAAQWNMEALENGLSDEELKKWLDTAQKRLCGQGFHPYYLYRQRRILANQENVGYALLDTESLYNIWMMEECRTILGLGGGSITKWVDPVSGFVDRRSNPKCPATFTHIVSEEIGKKTQWFKGYLN